MRVAHQLYNEVPNIPWSVLMHRAWFFEKFRKWLRDGLVTFSYYKRDGELREARGTLNDLLIPRDDRPKGIVPERVNTSVTYYDIDKKEWRSFRISQFIEFDTVYELKTIKEKRTKRENHAGA